MTDARIHRIDLAVESLRQAENFYTSLFSIAVNYREDSNGRRLAPHQTWEEAQTNGIRPLRAVLGDTGFQIALCCAPSEFSRRGRLRQVSLSVDSAEIERLTCAAGSLGCEDIARANGRLNFRDPYGIAWEAETTPAVTSSAEMKR